MPPDLLSPLLTHFGFPSFRPGQEEAIHSLLAGHHTLAVMPTGAGKSLIFQLAALLLGAGMNPAPTALVISPLIALMKDQVDSLTRRGIPATFINSALPTVEQNNRLQGLAQGKYRIVYIAPERLRSVPFLHALRSRTVSLLAVDEAHCISEWGHDFRPDYLHIAQARAALGNPLTAALTATATPQVQNDILRLLGLGDSSTRIVTGFNRPNLSLDVLYTSGLPAKLRALTELLGAGLRPAPNKDGAVIVYTGTRRDAEEVAEFAREVVKVPAEFYHAGLPAEERTRIQDNFISGKLNLVAATNAFGMGIDRADVRQVIHYSLPGSLEAYYQEAGRAGRDGEPAKVTLLYDPQDRALQEFFIASSVVSPEELQHLYRAMGNVDGEIWMTTDDFSRRTDLHPVKIKVGLAELERAGALEHLGDDGVRMLLRKGKWDSAAIEKAAARSKEHTKHRTDQLNHMINYAETNACRRRIILKHFGDSASPDAPICCDNCLSQKNMPEAVRDVAQMSHAERAALTILDTVRILGSRRVGRGKLVQILKGSKAQDIQKFHYDRHIYYAKLAALKQSQIEEMISQLVSIGYFKIIGGEYPVLSLTPKGETAIKQKASIELKKTSGVSAHPIEKKKSKMQAGNTIAYTAQLLAEGLTPEKVARQRGLTLITIYGHCAKLIEAGKLDVDKVVPKDVIDKIEKAIQKVGSTQYLFPIKALLPEEITYEMIRCFVESYENNETSRPSALPDSDEIDRLILECVKSLPGKLPRSGVAKLLVGSLSERVETYQSHPLYNRLQGHPRSEVMFYVDKLLENGQLRKAENGYLILGKSVPPLTLPRLTSDNSASVSENSEVSPQDSIESFLTRSHPRSLTGAWHTGWALGFHSRFSGGDWSRSGIGDLMYRLKYESDTTVLPALIQQTLDFFQAHPEMKQADIIIPVPSSTERKVNPVHVFCEALAGKIKIPMQTFVAKTRQTQPQKEMKTLAQKRANVAGAFSVRGEIKGKRVILIDDLFDSGATLDEITRLLLKHGASRVNVLTLTRTIHSDA
jgi:ATP-dependent DNA helicase RecQ